VGQLSAAITAEVKRGELMRFYVKQAESAHVDEFSRMTNEELEAFIREGIAELDASRRRPNVRGAQIPSKHTSFAAMLGAHQRDRCPYHHRRPLPHCTAR